MSVEVVMPQMGESITEGTVSKWLKAVGDKIEKDEAILEISTDKVDAEVPSPAAGTLIEIRHQEGETVEVGTALALIGAEGEVAADGPKREAQSSKLDFQSATSEVNDVPAPAIIADAVATPAASAPETPQSALRTPQLSDATEVVMPQMGESITEGTVSKWLKAVGDTIEKDEPLCLRSRLTRSMPKFLHLPAERFLAINVQEGETVEVGSSPWRLVGAEGSEATVQTPTQPTGSRDVLLSSKAPKAAAAHGCSGG